MCFVAKKLPKNETGGQAQPRQTGVKVGGEQNQQSEGGCCK